MLITVTMLTNYGIENSKDKELSARYKDVITYIRQQGYTMKIAGAAAGVLNSNIIARELGLKDAQEISTTGNKKLIIEVIPTPNAPTKPHPQTQEQPPSAALLHIPQTTGKSAKDDEID